MSFCLFFSSFKCHYLCSNSKVAVIEWVSDWKRSGIELPGQLKRRRGNLNLLVKLNYLRKARSMVFTGWWLPPVCKSLWSLPLWEDHRGSLSRNPCAWTEVEDMIWRSIWMWKQYVDMNETEDGMWEDHQASLLRNPCAWAFSVKWSWWYDIEVDMDRKTIFGYEWDWEWGWDWWEDRRGSLLKNPCAWAFSIK